MSYKQEESQVRFPATAELEREHRVIHRVIAAMTKLADELEKGADCHHEVFDGLLSFFDLYVNQLHHAKEDKQMFTLLEARGVPSAGCPIGALRYEHETGNALNAKLVEAVRACSAEGLEKTRPQVVEALRALVELYISHIWKEDYMLLPLTDKTISDEDQEALEKQFSEVEARLGTDVIDRMEAFPAVLERAVGAMAEARGAGVAPVRTPEPTGTPILAFDINERIEQLLAERNWQAGRDSQTIVKYADFRVVLTVLRTGSHMHEHQAAGPISIHVLRGKLRIQAEGETIDLPAGNVVALNRGIPHDVEALEESAFLLTIGWPPAQGN